MLTAAEARKRTADNRFYTREKVEFEIKLSIGSSRFCAQLEDRRWNNGLTEWLEGLGYEIEYDTALNGERSVFVHWSSAQDTKE